MAEHAPQADHNETISTFFRSLQEGWFWLSGGSTFILST